MPNASALLEGIAQEVKLIRIPGNHPEGWDAADALAEGWKPSQGYDYEEPLIVNPPGYDAASA